MKQQRAQSAVTPVVATAVLILFSLTGLIGGFVTHGLVSAASGNQAVRMRSTPPIHPTATVHHSPTSTITAFAASSNAHFNLALSFAPAQVHAGGALAISVNATVAKTAAPFGSLLCTLSAPGGGPALLPTWPAPASTNAKGIATWQVTVPQLAPGAYGVKVSAANQDGYSAYWISWIQVSN